MGIIMTGVGSDGAQGMNAIHQEGGFTVGQDEPSCAVCGMPRVCAEMGILDRVVPLSQIPYEILQATRYRKTSVSQAGAPQSNGFVSSTSRTLFKSRRIEKGLAMYSLR